MEMVEGRKENIGLRENDDKTTVRAKQRTFRIR
jgi:hypothetical protein